MPVEIKVSPKDVSEELESIIAIYEEIDVLIQYYLKTKDPAKVTLKKTIDELISRADKLLKKNKELYDKVKTAED